MTYEVPVERGKIHEFARATGSTNPAYFSDRPTIPPTFLTTARLVWEPPDQSPFAELGFDEGRVLHGEEEYVFHGPPPRAGQTLYVESRLLDRWEREGKRGGSMRFGRILNEFRSEDGTLIAEQRTTLLETGRPPQEEEA